jgi:FkbM family methyltransferase
MKKLRKLCQILIRPGLVPSLLGGTAPAIEHIEALRNLDVRSCIDVGANVGQFSVLVRYLFPKANIIAFEPLACEANQYQRIMGSERVTLHRLALGETSREADFYIASRADSSSLLMPGDGQRKAFAITSDRTERIVVRPLVKVIDSCRVERPILMKIDVQGGELDVLAGCGNLLNEIDNVYLEVSFVELYCGQPLASDIINYMVEFGFKLRGVFNQTTTKAFGPTQADFLFSR